jgi:hypothetical protein
MRQFQENFSNGLVVWEECHGPVVGRFAECKAAPRLIKEVMIVPHNAVPAMNSFIAGLQTK